MKANRKKPPTHSLKVYGDGDPLPPEAEELFARQLKHSRKACQLGWTFRLVCVVTSSGHVLGGVHFDMGPIGGRGPLAKQKLAYIERTLVRPEYRRLGFATKLMNRAMKVARQAGCLYMRCSNNWNNEPERRLFLKCGFALVDIDAERDPEPCYLAVKSLI